MDLVLYLDKTKRENMRHFVNAWNHLKHNKFCMSMTSLQGLIGKWEIWSSPELCMATNKIKSRNKSEVGEENKAKEITSWHSVSKAITFSDFTFWKMSDFCFIYNIALSDGSLTFLLSSNIWRKKITFLKEKQSCYKWGIFCVCRMQDNR